MFSPRVRMSASSPAAFILARMLTRRPSNSTAGNDSSFTGCLLGCRRGVAATPPTSRPATGSVVCLHARRYIGGAADRNQPFLIVDDPNIDHADGPADLDHRSCCQ